MRARLNNNYRWMIGAVCLALTLIATQSQAAIQGVTGTTFDLEAGAAYIDTPDGSRVLVWGYGIDGQPQYPGPTLIVTEGESITINLTNTLPKPTSIVFPGQEAVMASGGTAGDITQETGAGGTVSYTFTAGSPGTYLYNSGTDMDLQVEMGLVGAIIVKPLIGGKHAYNHADTSYDHEYMFLLTEMDPKVHQMVAFGMYQLVDTVDYVPTLWFINGRNGPDTLAPDGVPWMPAQPYGATVQMHIGEDILLRVIGAGRDPHPFHTHGNNFRQIARDGRLMEINQAAGLGPDAGVSDYTLQVVPGATYDAIFTWTGAGMGWDIFGTPADGAGKHTCSGVNGPTNTVDPMTHEWCPDHYRQTGKGRNATYTQSLPVALPELSDLTFGGFYSGSPFLGSASTLPPGEGGLNINGGMFFMWHSHAEKELVNNDVPPGGMLTMMVIEPHDVPIAD